MKKLTCYIVTYNRSEYLSLQLESVLKQTYKEFDLYIVDNCSTDNTEDIIKEYSDDRLHYIRHEENIGSINNIKYAFDHCTSEYMIILHDDDYIEDHLFEREIEVLENNIGVGMVSCNSILVDGKGIVGKEVKTMTEDKKYVGSYYFEMYMKNGNTLVFPSIMYRTSFFRKSNIHISVEAGPCFDMVLSSDFFLAGGVAIELCNPMIFYRVHENQATQKNLLTMHITLFEYLASEKRYSKLWKQTKPYHYKKYRVFLKMIYSQYIQNNITENEALRYIKSIAICFAVSPIVQKIDFSILHYILSHKIVSGIFSKYKRVADRFK